MNSPNLRSKLGTMELLRLEGTLEGSRPDSCSRQGQVQQVTQDRVKLGFECFRRWGLHSLSRQPVPVFDHTQEEKGFSLYLIRDR